MGGAGMVAEFPVGILCFFVGVVVGVVGMSLAIAYHILFGG